MMQGYRFMASLYDMRDPSKPITEAAASTASDAARELHLHFANQGKSFDLISLETRIKRVEEKQDAFLEGLHRLIHSTLAFHKEVP